MAINKIGELQLDDLISSGATAAHTKTVNLAAGSGTLKRGQLIGVTEGGAYGAISGSNTAFGILCEDVTLGAGTVPAMVYVAGHFNGNKIIGYVAGTHYDELRDKGIFVDTALAY